MYQLPCCCCQGTPASLSHLLAIFQGWGWPTGLGEVGDSHGRELRAVCMKPRLMQKPTFVPREFTAGRLGAFP